MKAELSDFISDDDRSSFWNQVTWCARERFSLDLELIDQYRILNDASSTDVALIAYCEHPMNIAADISGIESVGADDWRAYDDMFNGELRRPNLKLPVITDVPTSSRLKHYARNHVQHSSNYRKVVTYSQGAVLVRKIIDEIEPSEEFLIEEVTLNFKGPQSLRFVLRSHGYATLVGSLIIGLVVGVSISLLVFIL